MSVRVRGGDRKGSDKKAMGKRRGLSDEGASERVHLLRGGSKGSETVV
jgi:hypothetical protein